jgi:bifunctional DNA-binding transcriptional regulator/antitoxin component of YhaV-PrlF toxin-antitoxin module
MRSDGLEAPVRIDHLRKEIIAWHTQSNMTVATSTITSKWQVTIPEDVRKDLPFKIGERIAWEIEDGKLVGRRVRPLGELAGCLKSHDSPSAPSAPSPPEKDQGAFAKAALARHARIAKQRS